MNNKLLKNIASVCLFKVLLFLTYFIHTEIHVAFFFLVATSSSWKEVQQRFFSVSGVSLRYVERVTGSRGGLKPHKPAATATYLTLLASPTRNIPLVSKLKWETTFIYAKSAAEFSMLIWSATDAVGRSRSFSPPSKPDGGSMHSESDFLSFPQVLQYLLLYAKHRPKCRDRACAGWDNTRRKDPSPRYGHILHKMASLNRTMIDTNRIFPMTIPSMCTICLLIVIN